MNYKSALLFSLLFLSVTDMHVTLGANNPANSSQVFNDFDIDKYQEEFVNNNVMETLDTRPPLPQSVMVWLRRIGLPILNAFVAVRKAIRETWYKVVAAVHRTLTRKRAQAHAKR